MQLKAKMNHEEGNEEYAQKYDVSQLHSASFKNKYYRHKNRSILTSANLSKAISSHTNAPIPTQFYQFDREETGASNSELFSKKLRLKLDYLDS